MVLKLLELEKALKEYTLPSWDELPEINLYMDQVIILMNKYLSIYFKNIENDKLITPSIINNYVKLKVIPPPSKKKYSKIHIIYLIMVCTLKQCLSISTIKSILPITENEEELKKTYEIFKNAQKEILEKTNRDIGSIISQIKTDKNKDVLLKDILYGAINASNYKLLTERITEFQNPEKAN